MCLCKKILPPKKFIKIPFWPGYRLMHRSRIVWHLNAGAFEQKLHFFIFFKSREALEEELSTQHPYVDFHPIILHCQICLDTHQQNMGLLDWPNPLKHPILIFLPMKGLKCFPFVLMAQVVPCQINTSCQKLSQNTMTIFVSTSAVHIR